jgi:hypothetical protein
MFKYKDKYNNKSFATKVDDLMGKQYDLAVTPQDFDVSDLYDMFMKHNALIREEHSSIEEHSDNIPALTAELKELLYQEEKLSSFSVLDEAVTMLGELGHDPLEIIEAMEDLIDIMRDDESRGNK